MNIRSVIKTAALGAGICIFAIGMALAQGSPGQGSGQGSGMSGREARQACRADVKKDLSEQERREAMRKCMQEKRGGGRVDREARRAKVQADSKACRDEIKDQRLTEAERRTAMQQCMVKKEPSRAKAVSCRNEAETKKLERGTKEFRDFMRQCNKAG
jgi:hypothetical protein